MLQGTSLASYEARKTRNQILQFGFLKSFSTQQAKYPPNWAIWHGAFWLGDWGTQLSSKSEAGKCSKSLPNKMKRSQNTMTLNEDLLYLLYAWRIFNDKTVYLFAAIKSKAAQVIKLKMSNAFRQESYLNWISKVKKRFLKRSK